VLAVVLRLTSLLSLTSADKKVFPKLDVVGWYSTGVALHDADMKLQQAVRRLPLVVDSVLKLRLAVFVCR
jgi:hypothetical protein